MQLQTERLIIRPVQAEDWRSVQAIWQDFARSPYAQYDMPHDTADVAVRSRIARWADCNGGTKHMFFAVCLQGRMIGYIAFNRRENGHEIGYCFHSDAHGKGYAKESHLALFEYLRGIGITRFLVRTAMENAPSIRLLASLGFHRTGTETVSFYKDENGADLCFEGGIFERN